MLKRSKNIVFIVAVLCFLMIAAAILMTSYGNFFYSSVSATPNNSTLQDPSGRSLKSIALVRQPPNSYICGAAATKMVMNYYFGSSEDVMDIFVKVMVTGGMRGSDTVKMAQYLIDNGLYASLVFFTDLKSIVNYCNANQIPAIMIVNSMFNPLERHALLFVGYNEDKEIVHILDPSNSSYKAIKLANLETRFISVSRRQGNFMNTGKQNVLLLVSDRLTDRQEFSCVWCNAMNYVDGSILNAIQRLMCLTCARWITVY